MIDILAHGEDRTRAMETEAYRLGYQHAAGTDETGWNPDAVRPAYDTTRDLDDYNLGYEHGLPDHSAAQRAPGRP